MLTQGLSGASARAFLATIAVTLVAVLLPGAALAAHSHRPIAADAKPTIVLVHGAWADSSSWDAVTARLQRAGYTVDVPPNPLRGLASDSASLASFLGTVTGPIVLVGHSYGGAVISNAAAGNPNVKALVYVDAFIPAVGETVLQLTSAQPGSALGGPPATVFNFVPIPGAPMGDVDLYVQPSVFVAAFANDLPARRGAILAATQRPLASAALTEPSAAAAWTTIPSWAVIGTADRIIPPAEQIFMAQRAHAHITKIDAGHLSLISHPDAVTKVILQAAANTD